MCRRNCVGMLGFCLSAVALGLASCRDEAPPAELPPRAVSVIELARQNPAERLRLTGSVHSWMQEDVGFEVAGRVQFVTQVGSDVGREVFAADGTVEMTPRLLATLDDERYRVKLSTARASLDAAKAGAAALRQEIEEVLAAQLVGVEAERDRATRERGRVKELYDAGQDTSRNMDAAETSLKTAQAAVDATKATIGAKKSELTATLAQVRQTEGEVRRAELDLADCTLEAPFPGTVAAVHVIPGAIAQPGRAVVTLVMMDPLKVELAVSAETDRKINEGDRVHVYPPGRETPEPGLVYVKDTVADPSTRTYTINVLTRNFKAPVAKPSDPAALALPRIEKFLGVLKAAPTPGAPLIADERALHSDEQGEFVWMVADPERFLREAALAPRVRLRKVRVRSSGHTIDLVGLHRMRVLVDAGELPRELTIGGVQQPTPVALGVPEEYNDRDELEVLYWRERWLFRPGDLVQVDLSPTGGVAGYYVPMKAIISNGEERFVFIAERNQQDGAVVRKVAVRLLGNVGELWRIEPLSADASLSDGVRVILEGAQYVQPGERIVIAETQRQGATQREVGS